MEIKEIFTEISI